MKVYGNCSNCNHEIPYRTNANTRVEFAMKDGENKNLSCKACGTKNEFHVDKLFANPSNSPLITSLLVTLVVIVIAITMLFYSKSGYVLVAFGLPFFTYFTLKKQDQNRVSNFNRRNLKGRIHTKY
ncbi:hypothetical protein [Galbibacter mesophilus]|uniref:hypothetical protein n=1 Tax=Galbibacter mesophilus TaxID=379069 RepID=UPI00191E72F1|nr:hypothetical protein [Galbibacter mesophilus]MCM5661494.1 hypothetical protein [Galbibacter mesophilus]